MDITIKNVDIIVFLWIIIFCSIFMINRYFNYPFIILVNILYIICCIKFMKDILIKM